MLRLKNVLQILNELVCIYYDNVIADGKQELCVLLNDLSYPGRYVDMIVKFE